VANGPNTGTFFVRDAAKLVALLVVIGGAVASHYIARSDIERAKTRGLENAKLLGDLSRALHQNELRDRDDSATIKEIARRLESLERTERWSRRRDR
jgi:hypothetical protein